MFKDVIKLLLKLINTENKPIKLYTKSRHTKVNNFINNYYLICKKIAKRYDINLEILLAQFILETGWGTSKQFLDYNITHNIKFNPKLETENTGIDLNVYEFDTKGNYYTVTDKFYKFDSIEKSLEFYCEFMLSSYRYRDYIRSSNYIEIAKLLEKNGYATDSIKVGVTESTNNSIIIYSQNKEYNERYEFDNNDTVILRDDRNSEVLATTLKYNDSIKIYAKKLIDIIEKNELTFIKDFYEN